MKTLKFSMISLISLILFSSLICTTYTMSSRAEPLIRLVQNVELEWENAEEENIPIIPRDELRIINVTITYTFDHGLNFSKGMYLNYLNYEDIIGGPMFNKESLGKVKLEVLKTPDWCYATFRYPIVPVNIFNLHRIFYWSF